jgi:hypothetical protein
MSTTAASGSLTDKQRRIINYLQANVDEQTYFKSKGIGDELGLSAKEVGANIRSIRHTATLEIEKWGYSSGTTWMVTRPADEA